MHTHSEQVLQVIARDFLNRDGWHEDSNAAHNFIEEARARYSAEDDGDPDEYMERASEIFDKEKQAVAKEEGR